MATYTARNEYGDGRVEYVEYEIAEIIEDATESDYQDALTQMGVNFNENT